jgi:hypothetical protein
MDPDMKSPSMPDPVSESSEQSPKDAWLEPEASIVRNGYKPFYDPYDLSARTHEPNG